MTDKRCPDCGRVKGLRVMTAKMFKRWLGPIAGKDWKPTRTKRIVDGVTFILCPCTTVFKLYAASRAKPVAGGRTGS